MYIRLLLLIFILQLCLCYSCKVQDLDSAPKRPNTTITTLGTCQFSIIAYHSLNLIDALTSTNCSCIRQRQGQTIAGYYIKPYKYDSNLDRYWLSARVAYREGSNHFICNSDPIYLKHTAESPGFLNGTIGSFAFNEVIGNRGYQKCQLEYYEDCEEFEDSFISFEELHLISENSDFIGFSGSMVTQGAIRVLDSNSGTLAEFDDYINHFTLKVDGFNHIDGNQERELLDRINSNFINHSFDGFDFIARSATINKKPATSFAAPCPPRWHN